MAVIYVTDRKRSATGWLGLVAAGLSMGALLGAGLLAWPLSEDDPALQAAAQPVCCRQTPRPVGASGASDKAVPLQTPPSTAPTPNPGDDAVRLDARVRQAALYADCQALAETPQDAPADAGAAPRAQEPGSTADSPIERAMRHREQACRGIGPHEYRQIDGLLRAASQAGHLGASFLLLEGRVLAHTRAAGPPEPDAPPASDQTRSMVAEVEVLARQGHPEAMVLAAQLLVAQPLGLGEAVRAAAWNMLALELDRGRPLSEEDLASTGVLESLTEAESRRALQEAQALRSVCCLPARPGQASPTAPTPVRGSPG